jgi:hypothetical protein
VKLYYEVKLGSEDMEILLGNKRRLEKNNDIIPSTASMRNRSFFHQIANMESPTEAGRDGLGFSQL